MTAITPETVAAFIVEHLAGELAAAGVAPAEVGDDLDLHDRGVIDSFGVLELIADIEAHFGVEVDFEEMDPEQLAVVGPLSRFVATQAVVAG